MTSEKGKSAGVNHIVLEGAATAPIISFDQAPIAGAVPGLGRITLTALLQNEGADGSLCPLRVVVAHLRGNAIAWAELRRAIVRVEAMLQEPIPGKPN